MSDSKIILAGGGDASESYLVDSFFTTLLDNKNFLFLPQAISPETWSYDDALSWVKKSKPFESIAITMCDNLKKLSLDWLLQFDAIYLMGGNTYNLLKKLRETNLDTLLLEYLKKGRIIYGLSAGAIVIGKDIRTAALGSEKDENTVGLTDLTSLNLLSGVIVATHYISDMDYDLFEISKNSNSKVLCIPEASGVFVETKICQVIGPDPITIIEYPNKTEVEAGKQFNL
jgi:dipeptidase E